MMRIPKTFQIGGHTIRVVLDRSGVLDDHEKYGDYRVEAKIIQVCAKQIRSQVEETFVHELVEAINAIHYLEIPHHAIQTMAVALHQALTSGKGALK